MTPERTIGRLSLYRQVLRSVLAEGAKSIYSHQIASRAGVTSSQVRRDFMVIGYSGSPNAGYDVQKLLDSIEAFIDPATPEAVALVGVGNLGRAILAFFHGRRPKLRIQAAFDKDPGKVGRVIHGCRCYPMTELESVAQAEGIRTAILAVPAAEAQGVAQALVRAGVCGILNFAPTPISAGQSVFVENIDMTMSLEKVAYFGRRQAGQRRT